MLQDTTAYANLCFSIPKGTTMSTITTHPDSRVGTSVLYKLSDADVKSIIARRLSAGRGTFSGNDPREGQELPALIIADWAMYGSDLEEKFKAGVLTDGAGTPRSWADHVREASCNLQVFLDGTDVYWATSRSEFDPSKHGTFAKRTDAEIAEALGMPEHTRESAMHRASFIKAFQAKNDLKVDGIWGSATEGKAVRVLDIGPTAWVPDAKGHFFKV